MIDTWQERFDDLWKHLVDWAGSGFRYGMPSLTGEGLKQMKPQFKEFITELLLTERQKVLEEVGEKVISLEKDIQEWESEWREGYIDCIADVLEALSALKGRGE